MTVGVGRDVVVEATTHIPSPEELYLTYGGLEDGIDQQELRALLEDLDGLADIGSELSRDREKLIMDYVCAEFARADLNHDGVIDQDEFILYYFDTLCFKFPVGKNGYNPGAILYNIFSNYCSFGKGGKRCEEMESCQFQKLVKECGLLDSRRCRKADVDLVVHRARADGIAGKQKGAAKLQYRQFLHALMLLADKRQTGFAEVANRVKQFGRNRREPSMADFLVMADPEGRYIDSRDLERPAGLPQLKRGMTQHQVVTSQDIDELRTMIATKSFPSAAAGIGPGTPPPPPPNSASPPVANPRQRPRPGWAAGGESLHPAQIPGTGSINGSTTGSIDADSYSMDDVEEEVVDPDAPADGGLSPAASVGNLPRVRTNSRRQAAAQEAAPPQQEPSAAAQLPHGHTGTVKAEGGALETHPFNSRRTEVFKIAMLPSAAQHLSSYIQSLSRRKWDFHRTSRQFYESSSNLRSVHSAAARDPALRASVLDNAAAMHEVRQASEEELTMALKYAFEQYNKWEGGVNASRMDKMRLHKVMRDTRLLSARNLSMGDVDKIYFKCKPEAQPTINFVQFMECLRFVAMHKRTSLNEVVHRVVALGGPIEVACK